MAILFIHGADGFDEDAALVHILRRVLDAEVQMPRLRENDMSHASWSAQISEHLSPDIDTLVAHSFGGSTALRMLVEDGLPVARLIVLAAPDWGPDGWDVADYALQGDATSPGGVLLELHHCADDEIVPAEHLNHLAQRLPDATIVRHPEGGHQFQHGALESIAHGLR